MKKLALTFILLGIALFANAQTLTSTYFLDHDNSRFRINPAFMPDDRVNALVGIGISNITLSPTSNIGLSSFLFPVDGELVTGLSSKVPADQFLGGLKNQIIANLGANINLLTVGFRTDPKGFGTIELNARSNTFTDIPKSVFSFLKLGSSQNEFDIRDFNTSTQNYVELALGYSRKVGDSFKVGGRLKILFGAGRADMLVDQAKLKIDSANKQIDITAAGTMSVYCPMVEMGYKTTSDGTVVYDLSSMSTNENYGPAGFGAALDLGVTYELLDGLELNAAIQDLGLISWKNSIQGTMASHSVVDIYGKEQESIEIEDVLNFVPDETMGNSSMFIPMTVRLGGRYAMPFYDRLSFGLLETFKPGKYFCYNDIRLGATVTPVDPISLTVNYGLTSYGSTMGIAANFSVGPFQLFAGTDAMIFKFTPQGVPISKWNTTLSAGLLLQFRTPKNKFNKV